MAYAGQVRLHADWPAACRVQTVWQSLAELPHDAGILAQAGYKLQLAGVMNMFPHTSQVETMEVFERGQGGRA